MSILSANARSPSSMTRCGSPVREKIGKLKVPNSSQTVRVLQVLRNAESFAQTIVNPAEFAEQKEGVPQIQTEINRCSQGFYES